MNPSSSEISLPSPVEQAPMPAAGGSVEQRAERAPTGAELAPQVSQATPTAMVATPLPAALQTTQAQDNTTNDVSGTSQSVVPNVSDDGDVIEKEWVNKAKRIVERTRDDPYQQSEQLTGVKADYMKKRYNKAIKLSK